MRTSCDRPQACAREAILSTTTLLIPLTMSGFLPGALGGAPVKYAGEGDDLGKAQCVRGRPLAGCFAIDALGGGHERVGRLDALDEEVAGTKLDAHLPGHPLLGGEEQGLDVAADGVQELAFVHEIAVGLRDRLLDALLTAREHELFQLPVSGEQYFRRGCL